MDTPSNGGKRRSAAYLQIVLGVPLLAVAPICASAQAAAEQLRTPTLSLRFGVGALEGAPSETFGLIQDIAVDRHGRTYVLDSRNKEIRVFDARGRFLGKGGQPGRGPGEIFVPEALARGPGDTIYLIDGGNSRISKFVWTTSGLRSAGSFPIDFAASDLCVLNSRLYVLGYRGGRIVHEVTTSGRLVRSFGTRVGSAHPLLRSSTTRGFIECLPKSGAIVVKSVLLPELRAFSRSGSLLWTRSLDDFVQVKIRENANGSVTYVAPSPSGHDVVTSMTALTDNLVAVQVGMANRETGGRENLTNVRTYVFRVTTGRQVGRWARVPRIVNASSPLVYSVENVPFPRFRVLHLAFPKEAKR